jgi:hypothetical protein
MRKEELYKKIETRVQKVMKSAKDDYLVIGEVYHFNQRDVVQRATLYSYSKFSERTSDAIFWNIGNSRVVHFSKNLELDTKDLMPYGEYAFVQGFVLRQLMAKAYTDMELSQVLNDLSEDVSNFGSAIFKEYKDGKNIKLERVLLSDMYFDQSAKDIRDVDSVQTHNLTRQEVKDKEDIWDNVKDFLDKKENKEKDKFEFWEFWGYVENEYMEVIGYGKEEKAEIFYKKKRKQDDNPYQDLHLDSWKGRWLRVGVWERLFKLQVRINQLVNENAQTTAIASLLLFRTENEDVTGNVLEGAINGQIIQSEDLQQIGINNAGLQSFLREMQMIEDKADALCLTPAFISGEQAPSGTPFRSLATMTNAAKSAFRTMKQNIGEKFGYIVKERLMKPIVKGWNAKSMEVLIVDESDIEVFKEATKQRTLIKSLLKGNLVTQGTLDAVEGQLEALEGKLEPKVKVPKKFFDFDFNIKMDVTGEKRDKTQQNGAYEAAIDKISANPALNDIPLFKQYLENNGISWWKLTPKQKAGLEQAPPQGAGPAPKKADALLGMVDSQ